MKITLTLPHRSPWTHCLCDPCWFKLQQESGVPAKLIREPHRIPKAKREICCSCGFATTSGIYCREDPRTLECLGEHPYATEKKELPNS